MDGDTRCCVFGGCERQEIKDEMTAAALASLPLVLVVLAAPLERLAGLVDNEYIRTLDVDPEFEAHQPNRAARAFTRATLSL